MFPSLLPEESQRAAPMEQADVHTRYRDDFIPKRTQPTLGETQSPETRAEPCVAVRVEEEKRSQWNRFPASLAEGIPGRGGEREELMIILNLPSFPMVLKSPPLKSRYKILARQFQVKSGRRASRKPKLIVVVEVLFLVFFFKSKKSNNKNFNCTNYSPLLVPKTGMYFLYKR